MEGVGALGYEHSAPPGRGQPRAARPDEGREIAASPYDPEILEGIEG
jgi:hypothetical protein